LRYTGIQKGILWYWSSRGGQGSSERPFGRRILRNKIYFCEGGGVRMARPQKEGLDYFPLDVDMDQDDKLFFIEAKHGLIGFAIVVRLLMQIYKEGYYKHYDDNKDAFLLAKRLSADVNVIKNVINDCIN
jgi:hypothetical protein